MRVRAEEDKTQNENELFGGEDYTEEEEMEE